MVWVSGRGKGLCGGKDVAPTERQNRSLQKGWLRFLGGDINTPARRAVEYLKSAKIPCSTSQSVKGKIKSE